METSFKVGAQGPIPLTPEQRQQKEDALVRSAVAAGNRRLKRAFAAELRKGGTPLEALRRVRRKR
jgi:hypothetical protein